MGVNNPLNRVERWELVLAILQQERGCHLQRLHHDNDPRVSAAQPDMVFSDDDMREIMDSWRLRWQI